jgi:hypothetical protein
MVYVHHPAPAIKIPGRHAVRRRAMKMGEHGIEATKTMFAVRCTKCFWLHGTYLNVTALGTGL